MTSHSKMSCSRWMITPSCLSRLWRSFVHSSVHSCHLFLISSVFVRSISFLSFLVSIFAQMFPWYLIFLKRPLISHSIVFLYFFALITEEGFLISPWYSLELCIQMGVSFLFSYAFCFSSFHSYFQGLLRQPLCLFAFLFLGDGLDPCLLYSVTNLHP